jgi:hypothetical protein
MYLGDNGGAGTVSSYPSLAKFRLLDWRAARGSVPSRVEAFRGAPVDGRRSRASPIGVGF